jgi:hypothetical protein
LSLAVLGVLMVAIATTAAQGPQPPKVSPFAQPTTKVKPSLLPVAETRLLMEGLASANFRGLEKLLKSEPGGVEAWTFLRGQALLIAETGNLLMMRPPKGPAQDIWFEKAMALRSGATQLAASAAARDYAKSKTQFVNLAKSCNNCHQAFSVPVQIVPFAPEPGPGKDVQFEPGSAN